MQYGDDLVVGLIAIQHTETTDRLHRSKYVAVSNGTLRQDAYIQRIAVALDVLTAALVHAVVGNRVATVTLWYKAIERRHNGRVLLRAVDADVAAHLVQLIFYSVGGQHFDECRYYVGRLVANLQSVPGV